MQESNKKRSWKGHIISWLTLILAVMTLTALTVAWLDRTVGSQEGVGFKQENSGTIMGNRYHIKTYYINANGLWQLISTDFTRSGDAWADDDDTAFLIPSERTEFKTVIESTVPETQTVSLFLQGVSVDTNMQDMIVFGVTEPEVLLYSCTDSSYFAVSGTDLLADHLALCVNQPLPAYESLEIYWYINTSSSATGGTFPALAPKDNPTVPITKDIDGKTYYYYINAYDEDDNPTEAYRCDESGVVQPGPILYTDDFSGATYDVATTMGVFGNLNQYVQISGIYVAVG